MLKVISMKNVPELIQKGETTGIFDNNSTVEKLKKLLYDELFQYRMLADKRRSSWVQISILIGRPSPTLRKWTMKYL